ncbi:MAG: hypothetical protein V4484_14155 [Pseudomonadota bacterium]
MGGWFKRTLLVLLVCALCWGGAIWYWRATNRMPASEDLVRYLAVLPLMLLLLIWVGSKLLALSMAAPAAAAPAPPQGDTAPASAPEVAPLAILASALRAPHGASPEQLSRAFAENTARAELDPELIDDAGFPVMTARSADALDAALQEDAMAWLHENGLPELRLDEEQWRALSMGSAVASDLAAQAVTMQLAPDGMLQLIPILPQAWQLDQRRAAGLWLRQMVVRAGWPPARITLVAELPLDARGASPLAVLGRLAHHAAIGEAPMAAIMVACGSHLGPASVSSWSGKATLFTASQPHGLVPGEGAAGLLLADAHQADARDGAPVILLHTVDEARRHNSADETKRADAALLGTLTEKVLARAAFQADQVAMIVADTGNRTSRVLELMGLAAAAMPQLDESADVIRIGAACGTCGAVPFMTALAVATHHALERDAPVLCISNEDAYRRCAALIRPAASLS